METHFLFEVGVKAGAMEEHAEAAEKLAHGDLLSEAEVQSGRLQHGGNGAVDAVKVRKLSGELFAAGGGKPVEGGAGVAGRRGPPRGGPTPGPEPPEGGG